MQTKETLKYINKILKNMPESKSHIKKNEFLKYNPGSIWETTSENKEFPFVMILEQIDTDTFNAAPIFRWTESAGPEDLFLPSNFTGTPMILSLELEFSIHKTNLDLYKGTLESDQLEYIIQAKNELENENSDESENFTWGFQYLNKYDARYNYHEKLTAEIEKLQNSLKDELVYDPEILFFPPQSADTATKLAAAEKNQGPLSIDFAIADQDNIIMRLSEIKDKQTCLIEVFDTRGNPSEALNSCTVLNSAGEKITEINGNSAEIDITTSAEGFYIKSPDNRILTPSPLIEEEK
jgi:hypothetical protein